MALKYKKIFKVPEGFENLLNDFAKEILRNKPNDILDFGIWYFQGLENNQDPTKMDYPFKGTNLPEQFKSQGYQIPKIISAENKLSISNRDNLRLDKSMKKSQEINSTNVPLRDDVFRQQGKNDQIVENFGVENYHFVEGGIPNNNEYKVHNNPTDREFNINEVNGSGFNYKEGQFPNKIDDFEMGYNYRGGLKEIRGVKFPEMKKEGIILKDDNIKNVEEFIKTGGMATIEKKEEKKEVKKKEKVVKPPDFNTKDYDDRSSNFPDSNKDKIVEDTVSKLGINPDKTQNQFDDEKNDDEKYDDDSSNAPDSNKDKIIQHTASMLNKKINTNEEFKNMEENNNEIRETNQENLLESHEFNNNVNVETSSEKIEIKVIEKDGKRTVEIRRNGEEIGEDELPEEYKIQLENMKNHLNEEEHNENVEEYNENIEHNENVDENNNNENVDENNNNENVDENNNENIEEYKENVDDENKNENNENIEENNVNNEENNVNNEENNNENIEEYKENIEQNENVDENNENIEQNNENIEQNNENIEEYKENIEENNNNLEENNIENTDENNNINQANQNEDFIDDNQITNNNENNKNQYVIETVTETKTNENGEVITEKRLIVTKNGVEISRDEIPAEIQQQLNLIQQQIDEGKAKIETVENTGKIENTNKEIKSEINKEGEEEIIETTTKEVKELKDGQVVNEQKTVTTKKRKRRGENEEGLESDTDNEFGNENEEENVPEEEN